VQDHRKIGWDGMTASHTPPPQLQSNAARPLSGARGWVIADDKIGMQVQVKGVADALGLDYELKQVAPRGLTRLLAPWSRPGRAERIGQEGSLLGPPWPQIALATGRLSIPYIRAVKRLAGPDTFTVILQDPKTSANSADLIWVPEHDQRRGANVIATVTAPHSFSPERLAALRAHVPAAIAALPHPRVTVVLGGANGIYTYDDESLRRLSAGLTSLAAGGASFMITPSRRSPPQLVEAVEAATRPGPRIVWDGTGVNPYPDFLAHADALVVTADSVNMTGEACATGRPVYVFAPKGGSAKFDRFHAALRALGATRPLPDRLTALEVWSYDPLDSSRQIAAEIERRWLRRQALLPRGWPGGHGNAAMS
jgi:uncharacterized protein